MDDTTAPTAQDAAQTLIKLGWSVPPDGDDMERWRIGDFALSDDELLRFAAAQGVRLVEGSVQ